MYFLDPEAPLHPEARGNLPYLLPPPPPPPPPPPHCRAAAIESMTVAMRQPVAIEPSPSEGRMHAADTAGLFQHTARPVRGSSRTVKPEHHPHRYPSPIASTSACYWCLKLVRIAVGMVALISLSLSSHALE